MGVVVAFILCVLIWGSTWYAIELQLGVVAKEWSVFYRFALAAILMFVISIIKRQRILFPLSSHIWMFGTGLTLFAGCYILTYAGAQYLTSGLVAITFSLLSILNIISARIVLKSPIQPSMLAAALSGILGLVFVFKPEIQELNMSDNTLWGLTLCIAATIVSSVGSTMASLPQSKAIPLFSFNAWGMLYGSATLAIFALFSGAPATIDMRAPYIGSLLYLSIAGTVVAFSLYLWLIDKIGLAKSAYTSVPIPIVALIISTIFEGFVWTPEALIGVTLVVGGNIALIKRKPAPKPITDAV